MSFQSDAIVVMLFAYTGGQGAESSVGTNPVCWSPREIAWVVHGGWTGGSPIAGHVHGEDIKACMREIGHPAIVLVGYVESDLAGCSGAVHEERYAAGNRGLAEHCGRANYLPNVNLRRLVGNGRDGRADADIVVNSEQAVAVFGCRG